MRAGAVRSARGTAVHGELLGGKKGKGSATYGKHASFCLETQKFPDSVNQSAFESCVLEPGATYRHEMSHRFFVE